MVAGYLYLPKKYNHILNNKDMTWEEKVKNLSVEIKSELDTLYGDERSFNSRTLMSNNSDFRAIVRYINQGDLISLKKALEEAKVHYKLIKKGFELYNAYPGIKKYYVGADDDNTSWCCHFNSGELIMSLPKWKGQTGKAKVLLALSRLIRDAEVRCLKHPRHQQV